MTFGDVSTQAYAWELDGDLSSIAHTYPGRTSDHVSYSYDHDRLGREIEETVSNSAYVYDPVAPTQTVAYGSATAINTYPSVGGQAISYIDGSSQARGLHSTGNLHHGSDGWWYYYNTNGQMVHTGSGTYGWQTHLHDALGERYWSQHWDNATAGISFVPSSDGLRPETVRELDYVWSQAQGSWSRTTATDRTYVLGPLPDERLIWMEGRGADRQVSYPHTDRRGSTIALSRGGQAVTTYAYDEYGQGRAQDGVTGYPFRYTGQRLDPYTGTYHYKAREYAPQLGRFLQADPARFVDGPNVYAYVGNNPWNAVDPSGMCGSTAGDAQSRRDQCTGNWGRPSSPASAGQAGSARSGEIAIQDHYHAGSGEPYTVDPQTMQMGSAIDIGSQIQTSIAGGAMASPYEEALASGEPVPVRWDSRRFSPGLIGSEGPAGRSVGRFGGVMQGVMTVNESGDWTVTGTITIRSDIYSWALDAGLSGAIGALTPNWNSPSGSIIPDPNYYGRAMRLDYNRVYHFVASGTRY